ASDLSIAGWRIDAARLGLNIENGSAAFDLSAPSLSLTAQATLGLRPYGPFNVRGSVTNADLQTVLQRASQTPTLSIAGTTSFGVAVTGDVRTPGRSLVDIDLQRLDARV